MTHIFDIPATKPEKKKFTHANVSVCKGPAAQHIMSINGVMHNYNHTYTSI
jgi:hypothetical protein